MKPRRFAKWLPLWGLLVVVGCGNQSCSNSPGASSRDPVQTGGEGMESGGLSTMELKPIPLAVGARIKRTIRGKSDRKWRFETKTVGEMTSVTDFAFVVEMSVSAMEGGSVSEVTFKIGEASRVTQEDVLTKDAWIPPGRPMTERELQLVGVSAAVRQMGSKVEFVPAGSVKPGDAALVERLAVPLLGRSTSELDFPVMTLQTGQSALALAAPIRRLLASELSWGRVSVDSLRIETDPSEVVVKSITAGEGGTVATCDFKFGADAPEGALGSALKIAGTMRIRNDGRPVELKLEGDTEQAFRTMAGLERAKGTVSLHITWE